MNQFFDEFQANVRHAKRARYYRLARIFAICLITVLAGGTALAVETVTGSKGAATAMALIGAFAGIGFWWMISGAVYDRLVPTEDPTEFAPQPLYTLPAAWNPPPAAAPWSHPSATHSTTDAAEIVDLQYAGFGAAPPKLQPAQPATYYPPAKPTTPPASGSVLPWVLGGLALCLLLMCGGVVGASALLVSRAQPPQARQVDDPFAAMRADQQRQFDRMNENHREMLRRHQEMQRRFNRPFP